MIGCMQRHLAKMQIAMASAAAALRWRHVGSHRIGDLAKLFVKRFHWLTVSIRREKRRAGDDTDNFHRE
jgi:hypothetical protein